MIYFLYVALRVQARKQSQGDYDSNKGFIIRMRPYTTIGEAGKGLEGRVKGDQRKHHQSIQLKH